MGKRLLDDELKVIGHVAHMVRKQLRIS